VDSAGTASRSEGGGSDISGGDGSWCPAGPSGPASSERTTVDPPDLQDLCRGRFSSSGKIERSSESPRHQGEVDGLPVDARLHGPFEVIAAGPKAFKLRMATKDWVNVDRLKPYTGSKDVPEMEIAAADGQSAAGGAL